MTGYTIHVFQEVKVLMWPGSGRERELTNDPELSHDAAEVGHSCTAWSRC